MDCNCCDSGSWSDNLMVVITLMVRMNKISNWKVICFLQM